MLDYSQPIVIFGAVRFLVMANRNRPRMAHIYAKQRKHSNLPILLGMNAPLKSYTEQQGKERTDTVA